MIPVEDDFTELIDAHFPRVDLVGSAANGATFLIAKSAADHRGVMEAEVVKSLIAKAEKPKRQAVFDGSGKLVGVVSPDDIEDVETGDPDAAPPPKQVYQQQLTEADLQPAPPEIMGVPAEATKSAVREAENIRARAVAKSLLAEQALARGEITPAGAAIAKAQAARHAVTQLRHMEGRARAVPYHPRMGRS